MHAPLTFKISTFRRECRQYRNLISIGDGDAERAASLRLQAPPERKGMVGAGGEIGDRRIKSVKLLELPTCQQLVSEHEMLQTRLADVIAFQGSLDLKARFPGNSSSVPSMASKGSGCMLVHFSRPLMGGTPGAGGPQQDVSPKMQASPSRPHDKKGLFSFRSMQLPARNGNSQLPPLGGAGAISGEKVVGSSSGNDFRGLLGAGSASAGGSTVEPNQTADNTGDGGEPDRVERESMQQRSSGSSLWKAQGIGEVRGSRFHNVAKKKPVLVGGMGARSAGASWREHSAPAAARGF